MTVKKLWKIGDKIVVIIDSEIISKLNIDVTDTFVEQESKDDGIFMKIKRLWSEK